MEFRQKISSYQRSQHAAGKTIQGRERRASRARDQRLDEHAFELDLLKTVLQMIAAWSSLDAFRESYHREQTGVDNIERRSINRRTYKKSEISRLYIA